MTDQPLTITIKQAAKLAGIGRERMYQAVRSGELPSIQVSYSRNRRRVLPSDVRAWVKGLRTQGVPPPPSAAPTAGQETR